MTEYSECFKGQISLYLIRAQLLFSCCPFSSPSLTSSVPTILFAYAYTHMMFYIPYELLSVILKEGNVKITWLPPPFFIHKNVEKQNTILNGIYTKFFIF